MAKKGPATRKNKLADDFCRCIKKVRKTIRLRPGQPKTEAAKEAAAIGVCVKSVLQTKGRTLKKFRCLPKKASLVTQKMLRGGGNTVSNLPSITLNNLDINETNQKNEQNSS